jgi:hypothetical protein
MSEGLCYVEWDRWLSVETATTDGKWAIFLLQFRGAMYYIVYIHDITVLVLKMADT